MTGVETGTGDVLAGEGAGEDTGEESGEEVFFVGATGNGEAATAWGVFAGAGIGETEEGTASGFRRLSTVTRSFGCVF